MDRIIEPSAADRSRVLPMLDTGASLGTVLAAIPIVPLLLPGFVWITWPSFFIGLVASYAFGWYGVLVFGPIYSFFVARLR